MNCSLACRAGLVCAAALLNGCGSSSNSSNTASTSPSAPNAPAGTQQSTNWSGYVKTGAVGTFNKISGEWTVPVVNCSGGKDTFSTTWPGIGGATTTDPLLMQAGTEQDCSGGTATYFAWWEAFPAPPVNAGGGPLSTQNFPVQPGDQIVATLDGSSTLLWHVSIHNLSRGWAFTQDVPFVTGGDSAEWIEEAPTTAGTSGSGQSTLSNFGRVAFSALTVNGSNPALTSAERIDMVNASGGVIATPSNPLGGGNAFDVCYGAAACP